MTSASRSTSVRRYTSWKSPIVNWSGFMSAANETFKWVHPLVRVHALSFQEGKSRVNSFPLHRSQDRIWMRAVAVVRRGHLCCSSLKESTSSGSKTSYTYNDIILELCEELSIILKCLISLTISSIESNSPSRFCCWLIRALTAKSSSLSLHGRGGETSASWNYEWMVLTISFKRYSALVAH